MRLKEIAEKIGARLIGDGNIEIKGVSTLEEAGPGEIAPYYRKRFMELALSSKASALLVGKGLELEGRNLIVAENPRVALVEIINLLYSWKKLRGISPKSSVSSSARISPNVFIGNFVFIGENVEIGEGTEIHSGVKIYENVKIGKNCKIYSNVVIREDTLIGNNVILHPGVVIGADGFGFEQGKKIPQVGKAVLGDNVEIGANTCVDRAALGTTLIEDDVKIDNLCQIGHGVKIGKGTLIAGMSAIGGSTKIGKGVVIGGMVGIRDNIEIGDGVMIAAKTGVTKSVPPGKIISGYPHTDINIWRKAVVLLYRLARKGEGEGKDKEKG